MMTAARTIRIGLLLLLNSMSSYPFSIRSSEIGQRRRLSSSSSSSSSLLGGRLLERICRSQDIGEASSEHETDTPEQPEYGGDEAWDSNLRDKFDAMASFEILGLDLAQVSFALLYVAILLSGTKELVRWYHDNPFPLWWFPSFGSSHGKGW